MRLAAYAGASTALAAGVITYAFVQRTNFYSASVYLAQSNLCLMILTNLILLYVASFMFALQRFMYGPLRPIEIEQLYDKAWYAITETALAMTIFREEAGAWFLVMFVALIIGKVWGWIGDGRVEVLEQQPPANPRLFHIRLSLSLALSLIYDITIVTYCARTVIQQARPNMMVMFLFEFAVLTTTSSSTALRYVISLIATKIQDKQVRERLQARKAEVSAERERIVAEREAAAIASTTSGGTVSVQDTLDPLPNPDDVDEMDIEVPGWEEKGMWILTLDLVTDLLKLAILSVFFFILLTFYGLPIHIIRDLFITARSFVRRLNAFIKYRRATRDMNTRYPDATAQEIAGDDTCIICREEMRPWPTINPAPEVGADAPPNQSASNINERSRPKKLPCGHVLHLGCLKSWLERQQMCPTCRRPVVDTLQTAAQPTNTGNNAPQVAADGQLQQPGVPEQAPVAAPGHQLRQFGFGPFRIAFGQANMQDMVNGFHPRGVGEPNRVPPGARMYGFEFAFPRPGRARRQVPAEQVQSPAPAPVPTQISISEQLVRTQFQINQELQELRASQQELQLVTLLNGELERLRRPADGGPSAPPLGQTTVSVGQLPLPQFGIQHHHHHHGNRAALNHLRQSTGTPSVLSRSQTPISRTEIHRALPGMQAIPSGSIALPEGVVIPEGWTLLPLERIDRQQGTTITTTTSRLSPGSANASTSVADVAPTTWSQGPPRSAELHTPTPTSTRTVDQVLNAQSADTDVNIGDVSSGLQQSGSTEASGTNNNDDSSEYSIAQTSSQVNHIETTHAHEVPPITATSSNIPVDMDQIRKDRIARMEAISNSEQDQNSVSEQPVLTANDTTNDGRVDKGKGRAVTLEEADDDERGS